MVGVYASTMVLGIILVTVRLYIRARMLRNLWWDDFVVTIAMVLRVFFFLSLWCYTDCFKSAAYHRFIRVHCHMQRFRRRPPHV